jgi:A/G-specific adenine glycosylase
MPKFRWSEKLLQWFEVHQRAMPWRDNPQPYYVWVSEAMLQQTQVDTVIPYFKRFIQRFPTVQALAQADQQEVLKLWEGLGYYSRARNLHKAAKLVCEKFNGNLPQTYDGLQEIPGIGPYIAAAIVSIAFGKPVPVVDGNVLRVFARFWGIEDDIRDAKTRVALFDRLTPVIATCDPSNFNQAMMELGALVCSPRTPKCGECPLQKDCVAFATHRSSELPFKSKKAPVPHYDIAVGVVWHDGKILIGRRKETQMLGGLWEFPGGKLKVGENAEAAAVREVKEETGLDVCVLKKYCIVKHAYTHFKITLHAYACDVLSGIAKPHATDELKWVHPEALRDYPFPTANKKVIQAIDQGPLFRHLAGES